MVYPPPPLPDDKLVQRRDLDIIACHRVRPSREGRLVGVRWASRPDLEWPRKGYVVERKDADGTTSIGPGGSPFHLPRSDDWSTFATDVRSRRPLSGRYFPDVDITEPNFGHLRILIRLVDPRTSPAAHPSLTIAVAAILGASHTDDAELATTIWPGAAPPPLPTLLANPPSASAVIAYYRRAARGYLLALALRFEYAVLLGLATDDLARKDEKPVIYRVSAGLTHGSGSAETDPLPFDRICSPPAPTVFTARRVPGSVAHPAFADFAGWVPPPELRNSDSTGSRQTAESLIPRAPSRFTALEWSAPPPSDRLLDHGPVLYALARHAHGAASVSRAVAPAAPAATAYLPLFAGELMMRSEAPPHALDAPGMAWPELEGWYHYRIHGVDLLGEKSTAPAITTVWHHDDLPPPKPGLRLVTTQTLDFDRPGTPRAVSLIIDWSAAQDFVGPDTIEFRIAERWRARRPVHVEVTAVTPVSGDLFLGDVTLTSLAEPPGSLAGMHLILPDGEYPIVTHGTGAGATMRIRRVAERLPAPGRHGLIYATGAELSHRRIARVPRRPAVTARVSRVLDAAAMRIALTAAGGAPLPDDAEVSIYVHVLRTSFRATHEGNDIWHIEPPDPQDARYPSWKACQVLPDPSGFLTGSPVIVFPPHAVTVEVTPPPTFGAGVLMLDVTAADDAAYVDSPSPRGAAPEPTALHGNESEPATATLSTRVLTPPKAPIVPAFDPARFVWAASAARYSEDATHRLTWPDNGAAHYEVWRVLEGALPGASAAMSATQLRTLAKRHPEKFALRDLRIFGGEYTDAIPGRAPTRVLYKVRGVSEAGHPGAWSELIGPVHVPDIRQPPAPNLTRVVAPAPVPGTPAAERRLAVEWTQPGADTDLRHEVEALDPSGQWQTVAVSPRGTLPQPGPARLFRITLEGQIPGRKVSVRVTAIREARDPIDPLGRLRRDIRGQASEVKAGSALGVLNAPGDLVGTASATAAAILLTWSNRDPYESLEILRQGPDEHRLRRTTVLDGAFDSHHDTGLSSGLWRYQLRALGHSRKSESVIIEVQLP